MMLTQRWLFRRERYRPAHETINTRLYEVARIGGRRATEFVRTHHYSGTGVYDRYSFGLFHAGHMVGVAIFSHPVHEGILSIFPGTVRQSMELGRFVLLDEVPGNGESWFLRQCFRALRTVEDMKTGAPLNPQGIIAFSDPVPRVADDGRVVTPGHRGVIYQAFSATYLGRATPRTLRLWPNGRVVNSRRMQKIRSGEKGWLPASEEIRSFGADEPWEDRAAWLNHWLGRLTKKLPHPGNYKYAWGLSHAARLRLPASLPYPKSVGIY